jgi:hydroxylamine dehydrogenase
MARKPYTCKECHVGPDVPAFKVYSASKHGNIFSSMQASGISPMCPGPSAKTFRRPPVPLPHQPDGEHRRRGGQPTRTHQMSDRLGWRIFGLIYAHPQPKSPDVTVIRNKGGLPLPTDLDGSFATEYLISDAEIAKSAP